MMGYARIVTIGLAVLTQCLSITEGWTDIHTSCDMHNPLCAKHSIAQCAIKLSWAFIRERSYTIALVNPTEIPTAAARRWVVPKYR